MLVSFSGCPGRPGREPKRVAYMPDFLSSASTNYATPPWCRCFSLSAESETPPAGLVREKGVEPSWPYDRSHLKAVRLPLRHSRILNLAEEQGVEP